MDTEEWQLEFIGKGGAHTLLKKLSEALPFKTDVEIDYLSTLTRLALRCYR